VWIRLLSVYDLISNVRAKPVNRYCKEKVRGMERSRREGRRGKEINCFVDEFGDHGIA
jgi:hypothetical protein